jgi:hypothetical protein
MLSCPYFEVLYGGAAGGGKTDALIGDYAAGIEKYGSAWRGVIFRRTYGMLEEIETRSLEIFSPVYGDKCYSIGKKTWTFPNGATLRLRFLDDQKDTLQYQGKQYNWVGWDELTQWPTDYEYDYLLSRTRSAQGAPRYFRATSNPGGPGHGWVKKRFIDPVPPNECNVSWGTDIEGNAVKRTRVFIPAKLRDNKILTKNDPGYFDLLNQLSDPVMRAALRDGSWDVFAGMAFGEFNRDVHVIPSAPVPENVRIWRACDWGYDKPYCVLWFYSNFDGEIVVFNEMYSKGAREGMGTKEAAAQVREKIETFEATNNHWVPIGYLDPQCWAAHDDVNSIFHNLGGASLGWQKWDKGPGSRVIQKQTVHDYLKVVNGSSRLKIMDRCVNLIRTLPSLPLDASNSEDVDSSAEDHAYDALRGGLVRRVPTREDRRRVNGLRTRNAARRQRYGSQFGGMG